MSEAEFVRFLGAVRSDPALLARYSPMDLPRVLFHARNDGYAFDGEDAKRVIGRLEFGVVVHKDQETFDGSSTLWRHMWGSRYLDYLAEHVVARFGEEELS
ncbi:Nif11-like leader peptide family natural product precursor [Actinomadura sp. ATCC 31491]|uniref:Nif11-like leader peptide family natural product n=1 Tax=Actinomadura luzonensis TaxID=2805427 RepID=A0ABT0G7R6_9ACTN|nr:Nif11-like leader peptide family natural product precursor [Actinomadura luzonensis]MCK2220643.1 Nif11-like leader peptide family natural product precursor [Actinomadura luzonensis]